MLSRFKRLSAATLMLCALAFAPAAPARAADVLLYDIALPSGVTGTTPISGSTFGFDFTLTSAGSLTGLGVWDEGADGLANYHEVGIWDSGGALLAFTTITGASGIVASTSGLGQWWFESVSPVSLSAGTYTLGALYGSTDADVFRGFQSTTTMPGATLSATGKFTAGPSLAQPIGDGVPNGLYGPNAMIGPASGGGGGGAGGGGAGGGGGGGVPEPGTYAMGAGMAISALLTFRRRRSA